MKKSVLILLISLTLGTVSGISQSRPDWGMVNYLIGHWVGEGKGNPGQGQGYFDFTYELGDKILVRKSKTEFPASSGRPAFTHEDLMIIHTDESGKPSKATYWDNEGHMIEYGVGFSGSNLVLTSMATPGMPRFRLSYESVNEKTVNVKFEMSDPQNPDNFKVYLEGKSIRQ
jgi:hypothetical protein